MGLELFLTRLFQERQMVTKFPENFKEAFISPRFFQLLSISLVLFHRVALGIMRLIEMSKNTKFQVLYAG